MRIILNGADGRMGREVRRIIETGYRGAELAAAVDPGASDKHIHTKLTDFDQEADVIVDFSHPGALPDLIGYATKRRLPLVIATTGHNETDLMRIHDAAQIIPVLQCANTSIGIVLMIQLVKRAVAAFPEADIEIIETHHNRKADAPSGTALLLARAIQTVRTDAKIVSGRCGASKRSPQEIGISAVRRGNIVGTHEVLISTDTQTLTLTHEAHNRALFAEGAIVAAEFIRRQGPGYYSMDDLFAQDGI